MVNTISGMFDIFALSVRIAILERINICITFVCLYVVVALHFLLYKSIISSRGEGNERKNQYNIRYGYGYRL